MRFLPAFAFASLALSGAAQAGGTTRIGDQVQRQEQKRPDVQCGVRDRDRLREPSAKTDCKVNKPVPPVIDPTPTFLL